MKLWQAILIGCDRRAQAFNGFFRFGKDGSCQSCALGAAYETMTNVTVVDSRIHELVKTFPILNKRLRNGERLWTSIADLNDNHRWSREKIALEFVKPIEEEADASSDS